MSEEQTITKVATKQTTHQKSLVNTYVRNQKPHSTQIVNQPNFDPFQTQDSKY